jgi:hypothetical protein
VGIDVGSKVGPILYEAFGERMKPAGVADKLLADGRYGRKSRKGFYRYEGVKKGEKPVDKTVYGVLGVSGDKTLDPKEIVERCVLMMLNEAARCSASASRRSSVARSATPTVWASRNWWRSWSSTGNGWANASPRRRFCRAWRRKGERSTQINRRHHLPSSQEGGRGAQWPRPTEPPRQRHESATQTLLDP